jgi:recombination protein RecA
MARSSAGESLLRGVTLPSPVPQISASAPRFCLPELAGRLVELSGDGSSAVLTAATRLMLDAQAEREPAAWVGTDESCFFPPDLAESGVDLAALVVVRVPLARSDVGGKRSPAARMAVAAERLLRSGAFGLVLLDLGQDHALTQPLQSRLLGLAQHHHTAVLCLTRKAEQETSIGSLVSLRVHVARTWLGGERFTCELHVRKDKRRGPVWSEQEVCRGPMGLR